ncbi:MAG: tRNA (adenosine(37)-N6)-threonylcarbamoyltransferase complex ATPase subunit type 1 TsaE [Planctomycetes bacterium]|nr:tRNA (adenosine(37)-N6)-threonylcarbamoyltransferase complex ATPase subunit type 1 TsaE [Planctomycetota bacterium]MBI3844655.1 tRNA (adenosine(37)-N6)-threonylcarbamoyltransferase complex ATPase subunit type 1 TsaE [Planctomycetota bacterium]
MSTSNERTAVVTTASPEETESLARRIGERCTGGEVLALFGELGAGKTQFVKGLARGLGIDPTHVTSPTFVVHQRHGGKFLRLEHVDAYRLTKPSDWESLGSDSLFENRSVLAIEWADHIGAALPVDRLDVTIEPQPGGSRRITLRATGKRHDRILAGVPIGPRG